jgi:cobalt-zinc-cadmium efflux system membrane fusion protein
MCTHQHDEEHGQADHDQEHAGHTHDEEGENEHEGHMHEEEHDEAGHTHEDHEYHEQEHQEREEHEHETDAHEHEHDDEGLITVEGEWETLVGLETASVKRMPIERLISVPGQIIPDPNQMAIISPFIEASVNCVFVNLGDRVTAGDELVCLTSPEIGILRAEYDKAKAELQIKQQNFERRKKLFEENIISERAYQEAELDKKVAEVNFNYARKKLLAIGITEDEIDNPPTGHSDAVGSTIHIHAPIAGVITSRDASPGQKVDPSTRILEIMNLETVWCEADIFEKDLTKIKIGQKVRVNVTAYPDVFFIGKIFYIGSTLNPDTKTIKVLIEIDNKTKKLKPGMYANTHIVVGQKENALIIPREAVLDDEHLNIVFVKETGGYHRHVVETGIVADPFIEVLSGLVAGDIVVTKGSYQLKSKLKMSGVDPHAGHVH